MAVAEAQIVKTRDTIDTDIPFMVTMDHGYPSIPSFLRMIDEGVFFIARLKSSDFRAEQQALSSDDEDVEIDLTESRCHHYLGIADEALAMSRDSFDPRIVRVWLDEDKKITRFSSPIFQGIYSHPNALVKYIICAGG